MPDQRDTDAKAHDGEKPLSESLLGDEDSGGLAGQGGMSDLAEDDDADQQNDLA